MVAASARAARLAISEIPARRNPMVRLAGDGGNVLEVGVIVKDDSTVVLRDGRSDQAYDTGRTVAPAGRHPELDIRRPALLM